MEENEYKIEPNDHMVNIRNLNKTFGIGDMSTSLTEKSEENKDVVLSDEIDKDKIPDNILHINIEKANTLLDKIILNAEENNISGLMMASAAKLIDSITTATNSIMGVDNQEQEMQYKRDVLELKEREMQIKLILAKQKKGENVDGMIQNIQNNVIVASREDILSMMDKYENNTEMVLTENNK